MNPAKLKQALHSGQRVYGTLVVSPSPHWPKALAGTGVDFVFLDTEHIALDRAQLAWMCQAYLALDLCPIVRIPSPDPFAASMALDGGACGIVAPYVESVQQARDLVGATKLRPLKGALLRERLQSATPFPGESETYVQRGNEDTLLFLNIESVPALEALEDILAVQGIDAVQIGPHDLSCSLGVPEQYGHPAFLQAVERILLLSRAAGVGVGVHFWEGIDQEITWAKQGANLILHSADITLFSKQLRADLSQMRTALGDRVDDAILDSVPVASI